MNQQPAYPIRRWNPSLTPRGTTPASPCPICYLPGHTQDSSSMLEWRCARGHAWISTHRDATNHATFLARFYTGVQDNR